MENGPRLAAQVMADALYAPGTGYYRRASGPWGYEGKDYYTALDSGPLLGQALARRLESVWQELDRPSSFVVLEPGAGRGWLGRDILCAAEGDFQGALQYLHCDDNPAARSHAVEALRPWLETGKARLVPEEESLDPFQGAIFSNELWDALPAQPYRHHAGQWEVEALEQGTSRWLPAERDEAIAWFERQGSPAEGDGSVWVPQLPHLVAKFSRLLRHGLFLAIDYGDSASNLLAKGAGLRRFRSHRVDERWWEDLGEADLTADVDFTRLSHLLTLEGLHPLQTETLSAWVRKHAPLAEWETTWNQLPPADRLSRMENLLQLTLPNQMGERFRVLEAWRRN